MKGTFIIIGAFFIGVLVGKLSPIDLAAFGQEVSMYMLYILMFTVGITIGYDKERLNVLLRPSPKLFLLPIGTILGTLGGTFIASYFLTHRSIADCMAVGSGFAYYSLSSIFIAEYRGGELATVALVANIIRELIAIGLAPLLVMWFGPLSVISVGGATTMDTTLPLITRYSGEQYVLLAILHGILVDLSVPVLVTFFCTMT